LRLFGKALARCSGALVRDGQLALHATAGPARASLVRRWRAS
jgi:hypothetical protein